MQVSEHQLTLHTIGQTPVQFLLTGNLAKTTSRSKELKPHRTSWQQTSPLHSTSCLFPYTYPQGIITYRTQKHFPSYLNISLKPWDIKMSMWLCNLKIAPAVSWFLRQESLPCRRPTEPGPQLHSHSRLSTFIPTHVEHKPIQMGEMKLVRCGARFLLSSITDGSLWSVTINLF